MAAPKQVPMLVELQHAAAPATAQVATAQARRPGLVLVHQGAVGRSTDHPTGANRNPNASLPIRLKLLGRRKN